MFHVEHPRRAWCRHGMVARDVRRDGSCPATSAVRLAVRVGRCRSGAVWGRRTAAVFHVEHQRAPKMTMRRSEPVREGKRLVGTFCVMVYPK